MWHRCRWVFRTRDIDSGRWIFPLPVYLPTCLPACLPPLPPLLVLLCISSAQVSVTRLPLLSFYGSRLAPANGRHRLGLV